MIRDILSGKRGPARDIVIANAAAALWLVGKRDTPRDAAALAAEAIDTGAASDLLSRLGEMSHS
jgi:anthranilate phosphoribosyltransferase